MTGDKLIAIGCTHGKFADPVAIKSVIEWCRSNKPAYRLHLGDALDLAAMRSGAKESNDEFESLLDDWGAMQELFDAYKPTHYLFGNHEARLFRWMRSPRAALQTAATLMIERLEKLCARTKTRMIQSYAVTDRGSLVGIGDAVFMHGFFFNESATRDHAEAFAPTGGSVVHAHTHRPDYATGRRGDRPQGFCVGSLADPNKLEYATARRQTMAWRSGAVIGRVTRTRTHLWLCQGAPAEVQFP